MLTTVLIVILILCLLGSFPGLGFAYNAGWGYGPSGFVGVLLVVLLIMMLLGHV